MNYFNFEHCAWAFGRDMRLVVGTVKLWQNSRDEHQNIINIKMSWYCAFLFVDTSINTTVNMADSTVIKCNKCHIYKPRLNFVKDGPSKKLLKLCQLCRLKARLPYILLLLLFTFLDL